jgi:hypothetical protein
MSYKAYYLINLLPPCFLIGSMSFVLAMVPRVS